MTSLGNASRLRATGVWLLTSLSVAALLHWSAADLTSSATTSFEGALVRGCVVATGVCAVWVWIVTSVVVLQVLRRSPQAAVAVPAWARGLVLMACGVAVLGLAAPAGAVSGIDLDGLPMPDRASGGFLTETIRPHLRATHAAPTRASATVRPAPLRPARVHVVANGESLWSIAADTWGDGARWSDIYRLNRAEIGPDPDVIHVAVHLDLPHR